MSVVLLWITGRYDNGEIYALLGGGAPSVGSGNASHPIPTGRATHPVPSGSAKAYRPSGSAIHPVPRRG